MAAINSVVDLSIEGEVALVTINSPPVNALSQAVREGLKRGVERRRRTAPSRRSSSSATDGRSSPAPTFPNSASPLPRPAFRGRSTRWKTRRSRSSPRLHGTALGGGFEVALTAHYRIAVPSAKCGLPEIKLGIIPGAGGTQRLPRLIGPEKALDVILSGTPFSAREAREWGVVDELAEEGKLRESARSPTPGA